MLLKIHIAIILILITSTTIASERQNINSDSLQAIETYREGISYFREGELYKAINLFNESLKYNKGLYGENSLNTGNIYNALGITYKNLGNLNKAVEFYLKAEQSFISDPNINQIAIARIYNNIGNVYKAELNYGAALDYFQKAANIYQNQDNKDLQGIADVYYSITNTYYVLNEYERVLQITDRYIKDSYPDTKLYFLSLKAAALKELNRTDKAYKAFKNTINYAEKHFADDVLYVLYEYINFATFLIDVNNFNEAKSTLIKVYDKLSEQNIIEGETVSRYYRTLGWYYENLNVETKAINSFREEKSKNLRKTIDCFKKGLKALNYETSGLPENAQRAEQSMSMPQTLELINLIADTYVEIASVYEDKKEQQYSHALADAIDYYSVTSDMIQKARKDIYSDESKIQLNALQEETFYKIIQTAYKAYEIDNKNEIAEFAFTNAEQIKSSSVMDKLTDEVAKENSLIPDSLTQLEKSINFQITSNEEKKHNIKSSETTDSMEIAKVDSVLFALNKQREELNTYLEANYSDYYELKYSNKTVTISDIQKKLNGNEVLIEYVLNETDTIPELYSFLITKENFRFIKQDISSEFIVSIEETFHFMSNPQFLFTQNEDSKKFCIASNHLYEKLISPFSKEIKDHKIIVIPDGKLNYITFEALIEELPDTSSQIYFTRLPYLIRKNTINYAYSANLLFKFNQPSKKTKKQVLAFAPVYEKETVVFDDEKLTLTPLPGIQREVDLISNAIKTNLLRGPDATEENFRKKSSNYDILHLAMHAFINDSLPAYSRFAFKQNNSEVPENDGWLNTADIYNLDLNARLTVLSACNTGSGELKKGEGVISLARGFLYAGCPSIIMTQWEVEDNAGTEIMSSFYENLKKGRPTDEALRLAKLEYLENANPRMAHPHYWLGYVSIGNSAPLFRSHDYYFFGLLILVIIGIIVDQVIRIRKSRKH